MANHALPPLIYLSSSEVRKALAMSEAIEAMRDAFIQLSDNQAVMPPRGHMELAEAKGTVLLMPCHCVQTHTMSVKLASLFYNNPNQGLPLLQSLVMLADASTGLPTAIMDGTSLTAIRTGAASGLATQVLARQDAKKVAIFGAGVQARTQLEAVCAVRPIRSASVYDVSASMAEKFAATMSNQLGITVERASTTATALRGADVVCTVTTSSVALFEDSQLSAGAHINAIGSYKPEVREIPAETVRRARVVVDQQDAAMEEAGDLLIPLREGLIGSDHIGAELGAVIRGQTPGREDDDQITLFKSVGLAVQDLFAAERAMQNAQRDGLGIELPR
jgi:ornithine cyclodeaminase/alanine dehydrogenase-like protein (mu-crystallin family)